MRVADDTPTPCFNRISIVMDGKLTQSLRGSLGSTDGADRKNKVAR
jgi:hypothetical protein